MLATFFWNRSALIVSVRAIGAAVGYLFGISLNTMHIIRIGVVRAVVADCRDMYRIELHDFTQAVEKEQQLFRLIGIRYGVRK